MIICQCRFIDCNKRIIWYSTLIMGEALCLEDKSTEELILSAEFCCEPKTALKNKIYFKKGLSVKIGKYAMVKTSPEILVA